MIKEELESFRKKLLDLEEEIVDYLTKSEESAAAVEPDKSLGRLSRMEAMQDQQMVLELRQKEEKGKNSRLRMHWSELKKVPTGNVRFVAKRLLSTVWMLFPKF